MAIWTSNTPKTREGDCRNVNFLVKNFRKFWDYFLKLTKEAKCIFSSQTISWNNKTCSATLVDLLTEEIMHITAIYMKTDC